MGKSVFLSLFLVAKDGRRMETEKYYKIWSKCSGVYPVERDKQ